MAYEVFYRVNPQTDRRYKLYLCDSESDLPTSGLVTGEQAIIKDTQKIFLASSATTWVEKGAGGATTWGAITGTLATQTDLSDALGGKAASSHAHAQADITGLVTDLSGKTTLTAVKADTDIADSLTKKHANTLDHSNSLDHNGGTQDTAIAGKEPANSNIQTHVTAAHAPSNAQKNSDIIQAEVEAKLTGVISSHSHAGGSTPSWYGVLYSNQNDCNPNEVFREWNMLAVAGPTPTGITVSRARAVQFTPPANMTCIKVRLFGVGITANLYKFAIYPVGSATAKLWDSGTVTTAANTWLNIVTNFALVAGTKYWFCVTTVSTGTVAGFRSIPAPLGTNFWGADAAPIGNRALSIPVHAQFAVSTGVYPATLPAIAAAAYSAGTTGSVPFALLDSVA